jgi:hypothetical protein
MCARRRSNGRAPANAAPGERTAPVVIRWPADEDGRAALAELGVPRLLLVDSGAAPPLCSDPLEDWIRLPADERDIDARMNGLRLRASAGAPSTTPELDGHGRLLRGGRWVPLSPTEEQLCTLLIGRFGTVVSTGTSWPGPGPRGPGRRPGSACR